MPSSDDPTPTNRLECQTCPYEYLLTKRFYERKTFVRREREDVFGGPGAWDNAQKAQMQCPKDGCDGDEAAFFQVQIRSADEPMTGFYKVSWDQGEGRNEVGLVLIGDYSV
jgi:DNA-directed RNA polymerase III subunit RPC11